MSIFEAFRVDTSKDYPVGMVLVNMFWAIVLGYFALRFDSDPEVCMATDENDFKFKKGNDKERYVDVGEEFRLFFEVAFYGYLAQVALGTFTYTRLDNVIREFVHLLIVLLSYAIFVAWIWGFYCRMSHSGRVCSGDYLDDDASTQGFLVQQGMFIKWAVVGLIGLILLGMSLVFFKVIGSKPRHYD